LQIRADNHIVDVGGDLTLTFDYDQNTPNEIRYFVSNLNVYVGKNRNKSGNSRRMNRFE